MIELFFSKMDIKLDHIFIFCKPNASEADQLLHAGFMEAESNTHPGQGTQNRRFYFNNLMLEFLWVYNEKEVRSNLTSPTRLWERANSKQNAYCPFGLALSATENNPEPEVRPFPAWSYKPIFLPENASIFIAENNHKPQEPMIFYTHFPSNEKLQHRIEKNPQNVTLVEINFPIDTDLSIAANQISQIQNLKLTDADEFLMTIMLDENKNHTILDFAPELMLKILY